MQSLKQTDKCKVLDSNVEVVELETQVNMSSESEDDENNESDGKSVDENIENEESDSEYEQSTEGEDDDLEEFVDEENIVEEVNVNMSTFSFEVEPETYDSMQHHVKLTEDDLEVIDYDSFESDVGSDTEQNRRKGLRKLRKGHDGSSITNALEVGFEFANRDEAKDRIRAHSVETRRNIKIIRNDKLRVRSKCLGVVLEKLNVTKENMEQVALDDKGKGKTVIVKESKGKDVKVENDKAGCPWDS
ncbi:hypothetical protein CTI12_AA415100 [Artemisia annua]|uniref:Uncharacterized protein n=1 Tax=Artemisia annua TaxID=35608 RepID=A0A2U1M6B5_ARTAN|nr:hypothetical protein CTI12_AA415100 [Artemisia annua]